MLSTGLSLHNNLDFHVLLKQSYQTASEDLHYSTQTVINYKCAFARGKVTADKSTGLYQTPPAPRF